MKSGLIAFEYMRTFWIHFLRVVEKLPGLNFQQIIICDDAIYIMVPKCGTRSIRNYVMSVTGCSKGEVFRYMKYVSRRKLSHLAQSQPTKLVVRHPLDRLVSCWKQKVTIERDSGLFYFFQYYPLLQANMSFLQYLEALVKIPPCLSEKHFRPVSITVDQGNPSLHMIPLDKLDAELGISNPSSRANTTAVYVPSPAEVRFYELKLADRFADDFSIYSMVTEAQSNE